METPTKKVVPVDPQLRQIADYLLAQTQAAQIDALVLGAKLLPLLYGLDIERNSAAIMRQLRIRLVGTAIEDVLGQALKGHLLEEYIHGPRGDQVIDGFHHCADTREPIWMRQVVQMPSGLPRFVEGVAIYLEPERIYGGLVIGEIADQSTPSSFERAALSRP